MNQNKVDKHRSTCICGKQKFVVGNPRTKIRAVSGDELSFQQKPRSRFNFIFGARLRTVVESTSGITSSEHL